MWRGTNAPSVIYSLMILWSFCDLSALLLRRSGLFTWRFIRHSISINNAIWQILYKAEYEVSLTATNKWGNGWCDKAWEGDGDGEEDQRFSSSLHLKLFWYLTDIEPLILVDKISCVTVFHQCANHVFFYYFYLQIFLGRVLFKSSLFRMWGVKMDFTLGMRNSCHTDGWQLT